MEQTFWKYKKFRYISVVASVFIFGTVLLLTNVEKLYQAEGKSVFVLSTKSAGNDAITKDVVAASALLLKPEHQLHIICKHVDTIQSTKMTSTKYSRLNVIKFDNAGNILVAIETYDMTNKLKTIGGDVIVMWAEETKGKGLVSGHVTDQGNGSYTGHLKIFWAGMTKVYVKLASSIENTCLRVKALYKYGNMVYVTQMPWGIRGMFRKDLLREITACGPNPMIVGFRNLCNFTSLNGGISWFCGRPIHQKIKCSDIYSFSAGKFDNRMVPQSEKIQSSGHGVFKEFISLEIQQSREQTVTRNRISCSRRSPLLSWTEMEPSGYWLNDQWNFINCYSNIQHNVTTYTQCLKNKNVVIIGDSTIRAYAEYFIKHVLRLGDVDMKDALGPNKTYHTNKVFTNLGINLLYRKHEMPFHNPEFPVKGILSVPQILHSIGESDFDDNSLILIINYNSHFASYPLVSFRERIRHLVVALEHFLKMKPRAKVFFKGPHLCIDDDTPWFEPKFSILHTEMIKEEFSKLMEDVIYLDNWSITVAHNSDQVHPTGDAFFSHINQLMSYIC